MISLKYIAQRLMRMNYAGLWNKLNYLHEKTGKNRIALLWDMQQCAVKYGAGYMDYDLFEMYRLTPEQRDTYLTRGRNDELVKKYNQPEYLKYFTDKAEFNTRFGDYIHRDWVRFTGENRQEVQEFLNRHDSFILKPLDGCCGRGVEKFHRKDFGGSVAETYRAVEALGIECELEELIQQHPAVASVYPGAINTVRTVTINKDGNVHIICAYFRIGNNGKHVDNFNNGGMVAPVDEKTGIVKDSAIDKNKVLYPVHPATGTAIRGFQFPDWDKAMEMVKKAAQEVPQMGYVGWDVAFAQSGPCLVEGNEFPGHDIYQLPEHTPDGYGIMPKFRV